MRTGIAQMPICFAPLGLYFTPLGTGFAPLGLCFHPLESRFSVPSVWTGTAQTRRDPFYL